MWQSEEAWQKLDACFLINKLLFPRHKASGEADFSSWDSGRLEEHLVMEMTGKKPRTPTGNNRTLRNINMCRFAEKTFNYTVSTRLIFSGSISFNYQSEKTVTQHVEKMEQTTKTSLGHPWLTIHSSDNYFFPCTISDLLKITLSMWLIKSSCLPSCFLSFCRKAAQQQIQS